MQTVQHQTPEAEALFEARQILEGAPIPIRMQHLQALASCVSASEATNEELRRTILRSPVAVMS